LIFSLGYQRPDGPEEALKPLTDLAFGRQRMTEIALAFRLPVLKPLVC
jgi:hypothetical protein